LIVLALDTSVNGCAVCLSHDGKTWVDTVQTDRGQAEHLVPMIDKTLARSGFSYKDIDRLAVTIGPGSFTGVRIGLSTAKALALTLNKPLLGFSTFDVMACGHNLSEETLILIDTKRGDYYGIVTGRAEEPKIWTQAEVDETQLPILKDVMPDVAALAALAFNHQTTSSSYEPETAPKPLYLRDAEVSMSKRIQPTIIKN
jgi:tRNA threonylcarbamoyl adenosine modification protein YeaZ